MLEWNVIEAALLDDFEVWARARGDADEAKIARVRDLYARFLRETYAMLMAGTTRVQ